MRWNLKNRFIIPTVIVIILVMGLSNMVYYVKSKNALLSSISRHLIREAESAIRLMDTSIENIRLNFVYWSGDATLSTRVQDILGESVDEAARNLLKKIKSDYGYYEKMMIADKKGQIVSGSADSEIGKNISGKKYFRAAINGNVYISEVQPSEITGQPVFIISSPLRWGEDIVGVVYGEISMSYFNKNYISIIKPSEASYAYVYRRDGLIVAHPDVSKILTFNLKNDLIKGALIEQEDGLSHYIYQGKKKVAALRTSRKMGWTIGVCTEESHMLKPINALATLNMIVLLSVFVSVFIALVFIVHLTTRQIHKIVSGLNLCADQVGSAAFDVADSGRTLADRASLQAVSIEETSSALEEMSSMTQQNAANANEAELLMRDIDQVIGRANNSMGDLIQSMDEITNASEETFEIVKTIDEIAFQTNLLALNAAVEAARAGEAGVGFAVVATEVRNLALRSAEAAKGTSGMIRATMKKVQMGAQIVQQTHQAFSEVSGSSEKIAGLVTKIAQASRDQASGIEQVNQAVGDMGSLTQQTENSSKTSARASENMNFQTEQMRGFVDNLVLLIQGGHCKKDRIKKYPVPALPAIIKKPEHTENSSNYESKKLDDEFDEF